MKGRLVLGVILFVLVGFIVARPVQAVEHAITEAEVPADVTAEDLAAIAGVMLSLAFSYVPGLRNRYEPLDSVWKRVIMAALLLLVAVAIWFLSCAEIVSAVSCTREGILALARVFIVALIANQSAYLLSPQASSPVAPSRKFVLLGDGETLEGGE